MSRTSIGRLPPLSIFLTFCLLLHGAAFAAMDLSRRVTFDIAPQPLATALLRFSEQAGVQFAAPSASLNGIETRGVRGEYPADVALDLLLDGTGFRYELVSDDTIAVRRVAASGAVSAEGGAQTAGRENLEKPSSEERSGLPEVIVTAGRSLNMDIRRSRDDAQPYVIFERTMIEQSGAGNVEDFLKRRLTMNTTSLSNAQRITGSGAPSQINLRGLGTNQTLILIDGHRISSGASSNSVPAQGDINGIPLAAIERIEVLPTTASGIYGGGATGGVVNVVLRRDYAGAETKLSYDNSFDSDSAIRRIDLSAGTALEGGKTHLLVAASYSDTNPLLVRDRDFTQRGRRAIIANNPSVILAGSTPPVGATTNIRSVNGSPLFGPGTPNITHVPVGYAGGGGLAPLQANAGQYNLDFASTNQFQGGNRAGLLQSPRVESAIASLRREFSSRFQAFVEAGANNTDTRGASTIASGTFTIPAAAPNNPFGQNITVTTPSSGLNDEILTTLQDRRVVLGLLGKLPREWQVETDYNWSRFKSSFSSPRRLNGAQTAALANGTLDPLRDTNLLPLDFSPFLTSRSGTALPQRVTLKDATLRFAGPVAALPGGRLTLSGLVERRDESYSDSVNFTPPTSWSFFPSRSQTVDSLYLEAQIPLVSRGNARPGLRELDIQLAGRRDEYTVDGATGIFALTGAELPPLPSATRTRNTTVSTNPTFGIRYRPYPDLMVRASWGTGFLPPAVNQLVPTVLTLPTTFADPRRGGTFTTLPVGSIIVGGNPDLKPEESKSKSIGIVATPGFFHRLRLSVDWVRIEKEDNIIVAVVPFVLNNESILPGRVIRGPNLPGDPAGWAGPITFLDVTSTNLSSARIEAYDVALDYTLDTASRGSFDFFVTGTWQRHFETRVSPSSPVVENRGIAADGFTSIPLELKFNAGLTWQIGAWKAGWSSQFYDSYFVADPTQATSAIIFATQGARKVPTQTYHDVFLQYRFDHNHGALLRDTEIQIGAKNVFDKEPPLDMTSVGNSNFYSPLGDPRLASYYVTLKHSF